MNKQALKETAGLAMLFFAIALMLFSFTSCSQEDDAKPAFKKDSYTVAVSEASTISTGLFEGDYHGDNETAKAYLNAGEVVKPGAVVSVSVAKGETLFVLIDAGKTFSFVVKKNGAEVMSLTGVSGGKTYLFANK